MNKTLKAGNVLWIIVSIISLLCALGLLFFMLQEKSKRIQSEQKLSETEKAKRATEIKLDHAQLELIQLRDKAKLLAKEVEQEKKNYLAALAEAGKKEEQIKELENNLANEKKQRTNLANTLAQLRENYDSIEEELKGAKKRADELTNQFGKLTGKAGVELKKIVVRPKKELSGKVLVVNTDFHFVVIDLGKKDDISVGDEFVVYRGSQEVGKVQVEKVYDSMSTASVLAGSQEQEIVEDSVVKSF